MNEFSESETPRPKGEVSPEPCKIVWGNLSTKPPKNDAIPPVQSTGLAGMCSRKFGGRIIVIVVQLLKNELRKVNEKVKE